MMYSKSGAAQYRAVRNQGLVTGASPTRLVQIMFEHIVSQLGIAHSCMQRIEQNRPLHDVVAKGAAIGKAVRLIAQLNGTLNMEKGGEVAENLARLYDYMLRKLTLANATNDAALVAEVTGLVQDIKIGWDHIVTDAH